MIHTIVQCVLFLLTVYCYRAWLNRRKWQLLHRLPGPVNLPLIGAMYIIPGTDTALYLRTLIELTRNYGSPMCVWLGPLPVIVVSTAEHARIILTSPATMEKASFYRFTPLRGIFSLPVHQWRPHRKVIQPTFNTSTLQSFIPIFERKAEIMVQNLAVKAAQHQPFDIYRFTARCTLNMIFATTLGTDMHIQNTPACGYLEVLEELFEIVTVRAVNIFLHPEWLYRLTSVYRREAKALKEFCRPSKHILSQQTENSNPFTLMHQLRNGMLNEGTTNHEESIEHELNTIIFAGNETSAMTVANTLLLIAMHPNVQRNMVAEIRTHFGHAVKNIRYEALSKLSYMEKVLKESLRLLPIAAVVGRRTTTEINLGEYRLPTGIDILIDIFDIHRSPTYWGSDADQFRPERFENANYDRFSFLPFSAGPRNCVGLRYAWISMKIMLLKVLDRYTVLTDLKLEELSMKMAMTMKITIGHVVRLESRQ